MDEKRQKNRLELAFMEEGRSEAPTASGEGPNRLRECAGSKARLLSNS